MSHSSHMISCLEITEKDAKTDGKILASVQWLLSMQAFSK